MTLTVPHKGLISALTLVVPALVLAGSFAAVGSFASELPDPVAVHWGAGGQPDGFGSAASTLWPMGVTVAGFSLLSWIIGTRLGVTAAVRRIAAAMAVWFAVFLCVLVVGSLAIQRGLADAAEAGGIGGVLGVALATATVAAVVVAVVVPPDRPHPTSAPVPAGAARLAPGTRTREWTCTVTMPRIGWIVGGGLLVAVPLAFLGSPGPLLAATVVAVVLFIGVLGRWTVTIDASGLTARCILPRPRTGVPLNEIEYADTTTVHPLGDFGGWGYRVDLDGRVGIVVRAGEALCVHRSGGRTLLVTVDDAAAAAALLNTLTERSRAR